MTDRSWLLVDLDGTLSIGAPGSPYPDRALRTDVADAVAAAARRGYGIRVHTARGMRTYNDDRDLVERHVRPPVEDWLARRGVAHEGVLTGKPWCGPSGFYVDDRALHPEECVFRFTGPYCDRPMRIVGGDEPCREALARWFDIDDNGVDDLVVFDVDPDPAGLVAAHRRRLDGRAVWAPSFAIVARGAASDADAARAWVRAAGGLELT
jgi:capsule biosynthesis phosphatase